ncbi:MAG: alkaline phosphatase PhoX [Vicinamibacterales bacterium]
MDRRDFLRRSAAVAAGATLPLQSLLARAAQGQPVRAASGYGPLAPVNDATTGLPLLQLPPGFTYFSFGWTKDPMDDGTPTPSLHDGMAAFPLEPGVVRLIRNHEVGTADAFSSSLAYDPKAGGGTTTLDVDLNHGRVRRCAPSIAGTIRNCAGGPTPWGSWLTCEETTADQVSDPRLTHTHGWIFEVPVDGRASAEPLRAMGRFSHEAIAVDPDTGIVYETEDAGRSGFYKFTPKERGRLSAGGTLEMLAIKGQPQFDTRRGQKNGVTYEVEWVPVADPERPHTDAQKRDGEGCFGQGFTNGGAIFARLEGAWYGNGAIFITATSGGNQSRGQVWEYTPRTSTLKLIFESPGYDILDMPDNLCVSPRGGLVLCEDGSGGANYVRGLTLDGQLFDLAKNNVVLGGEKNEFSGDYRASEFAGVTFSPDGRWLLFNIQTPGITFAVTGPWFNGVL